MWSCSSHFSAQWTSWCTLLSAALHILKACISHNLDDIQVSMNTLTIFFVLSYVSTLDFTELIKSTKKLLTYFKVKIIVSLTIYTFTVFNVNVLPSILPALSFPDLVLQPDCLQLATSWCWKSNKMQIFSLFLVETKPPLECQLFSSGGQIENQYVVVLCFKT